MELTGFRLTAGQAGSEHAAYQGIGGYWLSIGIILSQQWGFHYEVKSNNPFDLPIPYNEIIFCVVATAADWTATGAWWYKNGATLNKIAIGIGADDTPASGNFTYLAIGVQQWGEYVDGYNTFPTEFTVFCVIAAGGEYMYSDLGSTILEIELHRFRALANLSGTMKTYIAAGKQQWGYESNVSTRTVEYPTAYLITPPTVVTSSNGADAKSAVGNITLNSFSAINRAAAQSVWWFSIGVQQWGFQPKGSVGLQVIDLLLSTTTNLIAVSGQVGRTASDTNGSQNILYVTSTADTVSFRVVNTENYAEEAMPFFWLLIAVVQQWGIENTFSSKTVIFQLPYKEAIPSVVSSSSGSSAKSAVNANSLISFNAYNQAAQTIWWISVGAQQWGYIQTPNSSTTVDLNIPYTAAHYACFAQKADGKSGNAVEAWAGITAISLTNFTIRTHYDNTNYFLSCGQ